MKNYMNLLESKLIMLKRKYGLRESVYAGAHAPVRKEVLNFIKERGKVTKEELEGFIVGFNESNGRNTNLKSFLKTNERYITTISKGDKTYYKLSEYGERFLERTQTPEVLEEDHFEVTGNEKIKFKDVHNAIRIVSRDPEARELIEDYDAVFSELFDGGLDDVITVVLDELLKRSSVAASIWREGRKAFYDYPKLERFLKEFNQVYNELLQKEIEEGVFDDVDEDVLDSAFDIFDLKPDNDEFELMHLIFVNLIPH